MLFVLTLLLSFLWNSVDSKPIAKEPIVCIPVAPIPGTLRNANGVEPILCLNLAKSENIIPCYPQRNVTFVNLTSPILERISCTAIEISSLFGGTKTTVEGAERKTITEKRTVVLTEEKPSYTCTPEGKYLGGVPNEQGIYPIKCRRPDESTINCYPPTQLKFPLRNPSLISCTPMPPFPVVCIPNGIVDGGVENPEGILPIECQTIGDKTILECYPNVQVKFPLQFPTRVKCESPYPSII